jgi:predicted alpha/beta hydrolase family esterase
MKKAIILHGRPKAPEYYNPDIPSASNHHWIPWLQKQLLVNDIHAQTPEVPRCFEAPYEDWKREFERFEIEDDTILVGHSMGAGFIVRWLSEHPDQKVGKVVLVGAYLDPEGEDGDFFKFDIDRNIAERTGGLVVFNSDDDQKTVQQTVDIMKSKLEGVRYVDFQDYGHFTLGSMGTAEFPELLTECLD